MSNDLERKHDDELWPMRLGYVTAAGRIKHEIDRQQHSLRAEPASKT